MGSPSGGGLVRGPRVVVSVLLLAMSAGCTSVVDGRASRAYERSEYAGPVPALGGCHELRDVYDPFQGLSPVDCSGPHTAEIVAVDDSWLPADEPYPTEDAVRASGRVRDAVQLACHQMASDVYLANRDLVATWTVTVAVLPDAAAWSAGARWVACAVVYGFIAAEPAPGRMAGALDGPDAPAYRICLDGDPYVHRPVPCSRPHTAESVGAFARVAPGTPFPWDDASRRPLADSCAVPAALFLGGPPPPDVAVDVVVGDEEDWAEYLLAECVLTRQDGGWTTTSLHP